MFFQNYQFFLQDDHSAGSNNLLPCAILPDEDDDAPLHEQQQACPPHPALCHELQVLARKENGFLFAFVKSYEQTTISTNFCYSIGDWFVLYQMSKNMNKRFFAEFIALLSLKINPDPYLSADPEIDILKRSDDEEGPNGDSGVGKDANIIVQKKNQRVQI